MLKNPFAEVLKKDRRVTDILARVGGEEFALVLPGTKLEDAMELISENAGQLDGFEVLMVLVRYHMVVHDGAEMPELNDATRRLGFFFWAIFFPQYIPVREYGDMYIRNHRRVTDAAGNHKA